MSPILQAKVYSSFSASRVDAGAVGRRARLLAVLVMACLLAACGGTALYSSITEQQANEMQAALVDRGIPVDKQRSEDGKAWAVVVPKRRVPEAMAVLRARGLPHAPTRSMGEVFSKQGLVSSPLAERARYQFALEQGLEKTLMQIDGVVEARVHLALPRPMPLADTTPSGSASVVIIQRPGFDLQQRKTDVKAIVTDGVPGINDVNRVTVQCFTRQAAQLQKPQTRSSGTRLPLSAMGIAVLSLFAGAGGAGAWFRRRRRGAARDS